MGGNQCCVINCRVASHDHQGKRLHDELTFHSFPVWKQTGGAQLSDITKRRRMAWITAVGQSDLTFDKVSVSMKVCSRHFQSGQPADDLQEDDPDWVPHLHLKEPSEDGGEGELRELGEDSQNGQTGSSGAEAKLEPEDWEPEAKRAREYDQEHDQDQERDQSECEFCSLRRDQINRLLVENQELRYELERRRMNEMFLEEDDEKVRYYTGLQCFAVLMGILQHVLPFLPDDHHNDNDHHHHNNHYNNTNNMDADDHCTSVSTATSSPLLSPFQKLLLTLMRLRLDLPVPHLAHLFDVEPQTVVQTFQATLTALHAQLSPLVYWPERGSLLACMPLPFVEALGGDHAAVVVDCLEVNIERPSSMKGREQTYSYQRHTYTMKYLVAMTPQGAIAFVSPAQGGRTTDMQVAEGSGILERLLSGDYMLAERGFELKESVGVMCAQVKSSAFGQKGKRQFDVKSDEETRKSVAHLRSHLEQVVKVSQVQQHFALLEKTVPISMLLPPRPARPPPGGAAEAQNEGPSLLDKIVTVCCALLNMCPNVTVEPDD